MRVVYVDFCNTLYRGYSLKHFTEYSESQLGFPFLVISLFFRAFGKLLKSDELKLFAFIFVSCKTREKLFKGYSEIISDRLIMPVVDRLIEYKNKDYKIVLVSAAISDYLMQMCLPFEFDAIFARPMSDYFSPLLYGKRKVDVLRDWEMQFNNAIDYRVALSDHISDLPLLEWADEAYVVNPTSQELINLSHSNGWTLINV